MHNLAGNNRSWANLSQRKGNGSLQLFSLDLEKCLGGAFPYTGLSLLSKIGHKKRVCAYFGLHRSYSRLTSSNHPLPWAEGLHFALWPQRHYLRFPLCFLCTWLWRRKFLLSWNSHCSGEGNEHKNTSGSAECCDENKHAKEQTAWLLQVGWSGGPFWRGDTGTKPAPGKSGGKYSFLWIDERRVMWFRNKLKVVGVSGA